MRISDWSSDVCSSDLLQLGASQGLTENELYQEALAFNTFWYPQIYVQTALYFKVVEGIDWADVDHRIVMGSRYSALGPWRTSVGARVARIPNLRSEEHTSELQSLMRISYAVFCLKKKKKIK